MMARRWFVLSIKQQLKRKKYYLMLVVSVLFLMICQKIILPSTQNTLVVLSGVSGEYGNELVKKLQQNKGIWTYKICSSKEELRESVQSSQAECGFIFADDFEQRMANGDYMALFTYVSSPATLKGSLVKEAIYAKLFELQTNHLMENEIHQGKLFYRTDDNLVEQVKNLHDELLLSDEVFSLNYEMAAGQQATAQARTVTVQCAYYFLFFMALISGVHLFDQNMVTMHQCLNRYSRWLFDYIQIAAGIIGIALVQLIYLVATNEIHHILATTISLIIFVVIVSLWVLVLTRCFKRNMTYISCILPVFIFVILVNFDTFVPAWRILKWLTPLPY